MSTDPVARYARKIKRPLSDAERRAVEAVPPQNKTTPGGDPRKLKRALRNAATKARRGELGLKAKAR
jgi:hypothetical protein